MNGKVVLEWSELDDSRYWSWIKPNFCLSKFIVISIQEIKLPNFLQFPSFLSMPHPKPCTTPDHIQMCLFFRLWVPTFVTEKLGSKPKPTNIWLIFRLNVWKGFTKKFLNPLQLKLWCGTKVNFKTNKNIWINKKRYEMKSNVELKNKKYALEMVRTGTALW